MNIIKNGEQVKKKYEDLLFRVGELATQPVFGAVLPENRYGKANGASAAYADALERNGAKIGVRVARLGARLSQIPHAIRELQQQKGLSAIMVLTPLPTDSKRTVRRILEHIPEKYDVDQQRPGEVRPTPTSDSMIGTLDGNGISLMGLRTAVIGVGSRAGAPALHTLQERGLDPWPIDPGPEYRNLHMLSRAVRQSQVILLSAGVPGNVGASQLGSGEKYLVDGGVKVVDGVVRGDLADDVFNMRRSNVFATRVGTVGMLTNANIFDAAVQNAELQQIGADAVTLVI